MRGVEEVSKEEADELEEKGDGTVGGEDPEGAYGHVVDHHVGVGVGGVHGGFPVGWDGVCLGVCIGLVDVSVRIC